MIKPKRQQYTKVNANYMQMYCLQSWFIRSSWLEKLRLAKEFVNNTDTDVLRTLLQTLTPEYIKAVCYRNSQTENNFALDIVPQDTNRLLSPSVLKSAQSNAIAWYTSLERNMHLSVILAMILLGGAAFTSHLMSYIKSKICPRTFDSPTHQTKVEEPIEVDIPVSEATTKKGKKKKGRKSSVSQKSKLGKQKASVVASEQKSEEVGKSGASKTNFFVNEEVEHFLDAWNEELNMLKLAHMDDDEEDKPKTSKGKGKNNVSKKQPDVVDEVQILPLWVNRAILQYLNSKDLTNVKNVNPYWSNMVDNLKKEQTARTTLNKTLARMTNKSVVKSETVAEKNKSAKGSRSDKSAKTNKTIKPSRKLTETNVVETESFNDPPDPTGLPHTEDTTKCRDFSNVVFPKYTIPTRFSDTSSSVYPAGSLLAMPCGRDIELYSLRVGNILPITFQGHVAMVTAVRFHDGGDLLSASCDKTIRYFLFVTPQTLSRRWSLHSSTPVLVYHGHTEPVVALSVSRHHVASAALNSIVKVFHVDGGYCIWTLEWLPNIPTSLQLSNCGALYISSEQGYMAAFNIYKQNNLPENVIAHKGSVKCLLLDGELLFSCGDDGCVRLWNRSDIDKPLAVLEHDRKPVTCMCLAGKVLLSGCKDGSLYLWNIQTGERLRTFRGKFRELHSVHSFKAVDHVKVVLHFDCQIQVLEFPSTESYVGFDRTNARSKRIKTLATRCCTRKSLLKLKGKKYEYNPIILEASKQSEPMARDLCAFPRYC